MVPRKVPSSVDADCSAAAVDSPSESGPKGPCNFARPKSAIRTTPDLEIRMFAGLMSGFRSRVSRRQSRRDLNPDIERLSERQLPGVQESTERFPIHQLRDEVGKAFLPAGVQDADDVGIRQRGHGIHLA